MPVNMQNLQNLANITSLDQLKVGADNQLQHRSGIGSFFLKIGDAFRRLSQSGRAAIAQRNDRILNAMRAAVDSARATVQAEDRPVADRLTSVFQRLQAASANTSNAALSGLQSSIVRLQTQAAAVKHGVAADPRFTALPERSQKALLHALDTVDSGREPDKAAAKERLKNDFFGVRSAEYDIAEGARAFSNDLVADFLKPEQQRKVSPDGIHESFFLDARRHSIDTINGVRAPRLSDPHLTGTDDQKRDAIAKHCERELRTMLGETHANILPFVSMMASQAGLDSAMVFLPFQSGLSDPNDYHLEQAGIKGSNADTTKSLSISREGDTLSLTTVFTRGFMDSNAGRSDAVLFLKGAVTMKIDLSAPPRCETLNGRDVFIPQYTLENVDVRFETPTE
ncbi:hypothetical protein [Mailhella sp.]|uniref:hypothetical protein n=1 Tax=Mailhella sp. TaxID=1981029 RepID=UPI004063678E